MGFPRKEYWSGLPFPFPGDLPDPAIQPGSPTLQANSLLSEPPSQEYPPEEGMTPHPSILSWRIPGEEEPGGLQSIRWQRVRHDWSDLAHTHVKIQTKYHLFSDAFPIRDSCTIIPHLQPFYCISHILSQLLAVSSTKLWILWEQELHHIRLWITSPWHITQSRKAFKVYWINTQASLLSEKTREQKYLTSKKILLIIKIKALSLL